METGRGFFYLNFICGGNTKHVYSRLYVYQSKPYYLFKILILCIGLTSYCIKIIHCSITSTFKLTELKIIHRLLCMTVLIPIC